MIEDPLNEQHVAWEVPSLDSIDMQGRDLFYSGTSRSDPMEGISVLLNIGSKLGHPLATLH